MLSKSRALTAAGIPVNEMNTLLIDRGSCRLEYKAVRTTFVKNRKKEFIFSFWPHSITGTGPEKSQRFGPCGIIASAESVGHDCVWIS